MFLANWLPWWQGWGSPGHTVLVWGSTLASRWLGFLVGGWQGELQLPPFHLVGAGEIPIQPGAQVSFYYSQLRGSDLVPALRGSKPKESPFSFFA